MTHIQAAGPITRSGSRTFHYILRYTRSAIPNAILEVQVVSPVDTSGTVPRVRMGKGKDKQQRQRRTADQIARDDTNESSASQRLSRSARRAFAKSGFAVPSSSGKTAVESTTVVSVKSKPAVAPATVEPNAVAPVVATQAEAAAPPLKTVPTETVRTGRGSGIDKPPGLQKLP